MIESGPFEIPEKCANCLFVKACLSDFEDEQEDINNRFKDFGADLHEVEAIYNAGSTERPLSEPAKVLMRQRWREAIHKLTRSSLEVQAFFDEIDKECPGLTEETEEPDCNFPLHLA